MPRGTKKNERGTDALLYVGYFKDERSFVSMDDHEYLKGQDISDRRWMIFERDWHTCQECGVEVTDETGELDHKQGGLTGRCDCPHNLQTLCKPCHRAKHVRPQWTRKASAA